jgi:hypothetical protein
MSYGHLNIVIDDVNGLQALIKDHKFSFFPAKGDITLKLEQLTADENTKWQNQLQKHYFACGCKEGSAMSLFFFAAYLLYTIFFQTINAILKWEIWVLSFIFLLTGAVIGKIIGLIHSKYAFNIAVKKLISSIS